MIPGGAGDNRTFMSGKWSLEVQVAELMIALLHDPQTSGGLFVAIPVKAADRFSDAYYQKVTQRSQGHEEYCSHSNPFNCLHVDSRV